jgi:hypothetical protein
VATRLLKEHLTRGYTLNQQRFEANARELVALQIIRKTAATESLSPDISGLRTWLVTPKPSLVATL